jgi:alpha-amylase
MENGVNSRVDWAASTNIYEVNIRQYTPEGTFDAFAQSLPRLKAMGVETLWFMPIQPVGIKNRKGTLGSYYSISDYTSINPEFGTLRDFRELVKDAQAMGFKVIIDWVANHTAWDHVWTRSHPEFYTKDSNGGFRPPYPDWADVIDLDYDNQELWHAMIADMKFWVTETGIDGFRCDMAHLVPLDFWKEARRQLDATKSLFWLAETEEPNYHEAFDASYTWEFLHKMEAYWRRETDIAGLDSVLFKYDSVFPPNAIRMYFTSNHDENSHSGSEHERMGNAAKAFSVFTATWNGIPLIYSGQELPNLKRIQFFEKDSIQWTGMPALEDFYKTLLELHKNHPALRAADNNVTTYRIQTSSDSNVFGYLRKNRDREVLVLLNLSNDELELSIIDARVNGQYTDVFNGGHLNVTGPAEEVSLNMPAWSYYVFQK